MDKEEGKKVLRRLEKVERRMEAIERRTVHLVDMLDCMAKILENNDGVEEK